MKATTQEQLIEITNNLGMSGELLSSVFYYAHRIADYKTPANQVGMEVFVDGGFTLALEIGDDVKGETINKILHSLFCSGLKVTALHRSQKVYSDASRHEFRVEYRGELR